MSSIKPKTGICVDCMEFLDNSTPRLIMAKRCIEGPYYHYKKFNSKKHLEKSIKNKKAKSDRASSYSSEGYTIGKWFNDQIAKMPSDCENCGVYLNRFAPWPTKSYIAHILPKRHFESVMLHPFNRIFLCIDCHAKFDNSLSREVVLMNVFPIAVSRFNNFKSLIIPDEICHLPPCFEAIF